MQALYIFPLPNAFLVSDEFAPVTTKFDQNFSFNIKSDPKDENSKEEQDFIFPCENPHGSLRTADEIFDNGLIRPIFPMFEEYLLIAATNGSSASPPHPPLKKVFVEQRCEIFPFDLKSYGTPQGQLCELSQNMVALERELKDSKEMCKKSKSTWFSKLWRFRRAQKLQSNSDDKDTFVLLKPRTPINLEKMEKYVVGKKEKRNTKSLSAHEKLYMMNKQRKENDKRRSFLPYKQQLVGLFANANGLSRNLHPF